MRCLRLAATLAFVLMTAACAQVRSDVTRFTEMPAVASGHTFVILPYKTQEGSLEFQTYAGNVATHLQQAGYRMVTDIRQADYAVFLAYAVGDPQTVVGSMPVFGQTGGGYNNQTGTFNGFGTYGNSFGTYSGSTYSAPTYGVVGEVPYTSTTYTRALAMDIVDLHKSTPTQVHTAFEGKVISTGSNGNFAVVAGCLIDAMFDGFPGSNGASKTVQVPMDKCSK
jgi:hypothetical protein